MSRSSKGVVFARVTRPLVSVLDGVMVFEAVRCEHGNPEFPFPPFSDRQPLRGSTPTRQTSVLLSKLVSLLAIDCEREDALADVSTFEWLPVVELSVYV